MRSVDRSQPEIIARQLKPLIEELLEDLRVVFINGPRQAGKTTLLRQLHSARGGSFYTLDQPEIYQAAKDDPIGFLSDKPRPMFIDEVQRGGDDLIRAIKMAVDTDPLLGSFILSASSRFLTIPTLSESLAGRAAITELWPLSLAERAGAVPDFIDRLLDNPSAFRSLPASPLTRLDYLKLVCSGGFPELLRAKSPRARSNWINGYLTTLIQRDLRDLAELRQGAEIPRMLALLAGLTAQTVKIARLAESLGLDSSTVRRYLPLLEQVYFIHWIPAWSNNLTVRATRAPKMHFADTGIAAKLTNRSAQSLAEPGVSEAGMLFETFVVGELMKQIQLASNEVQLFHYRDRDGAEIDCVLETPDRRLAGIEVKLAMSVNEADFRHLRLMRDQQRGKFVCGVLVYCGQHVVSFGDKLFAVPASALWGGLPIPGSSS
jgi:predicted AAA+ superfamily ATPase